MIRVDPKGGKLELMVDPEELASREASSGPNYIPTYGRDLFEVMRGTVSTADLGGSVFRGGV